MSEICSFNLAHYKYCLELAKKNGYKFMTMKDFVSNKNALTEFDKIIVLRHDIDHYLKLALNFANIEKELGISATYFIRCHANYTPCSFEGYKIIKTLLEMGHEIGLHHDCDFAKLFGEDSRDFLRRDKKILESITNRKVVGISSHAPNKSEFIIQDKDLQEFGFAYQAYSDIFLKEMKYISDSSSRWREGCMCSFIKQNTQRLCILTHPIWWFDKSPLENY